MTYLKKTLLAALFLIPACDMPYGPKTNYIQETGNPMEVTIDEAESILTNLMEQMEALGTKSGNGASLQRAISDKYSVSLSDKAATKSGETSNIHIFNFENESGFAIMSGDRQTPPLLAYTFKGSLQKGDTVYNPGLTIYLSSLQRYLDGRKDTIDSPYPIDFTLYDITEMVNGKCPVKWGQGSPYNYYSPTINGTRCPACCVNVALAQLMCTYKYPETYDNYLFNWEEMIERSNELSELDPLYWLGGDSTANLGVGFIDSITILPPADSIPDQALLQIAKLMQLLGTEENLNTEYDINSSSASMGGIPRTLENFGYSSGGYYRRTIDVEYEILRQDVINELKKGYYIIMSGKEIYTSVFMQVGHEDEYVHIIGPEKTASIHCWMVHGLMTIKTDDVYHNIGQQKEDNYFLCNFGWNGFADGFYFCDVFDVNEGADYPDGFGDVKTTIDVDEGNYSCEFNYVIGIRK